MERRFALLRHDHRNVATSGWTDGERDGSFGSGTYTPTSSNLVNCSTAAASGDWVWLRVGDVVQVFGRAQIDPVAAGQVHARFTLPIATTLNTAFGSGHCSGSQQVGAAIVPAAAGYAEFQFYCTATSDTDFFFNFSYRIG